MEKIFAQSLNLPDGSTLNGPLTSFFNGSTTVGTVINKIVPYIFAFAGFALLLMVISAGYSFLTSVGNPKGLEAGKKRLSNAVLGFVVIFVAYWLVQIAGRIFGICEICEIFPSAGCTPCN
jgi:VIT1/CCC1 family predicted Fe2+/Mn2+ transporter